jgi:hypothetical protein
MAVMRMLFGAAATLVLVSGLVSAAPVAIKGDMNGDGRITKVDVQIAMSVFLRPQTATEAQRRAADMDGDGKVTLKDLRIMLQKAS